MVKNVVIDLPEAVVDAARTNAFESGKSLKEVIEKAITDTAETAPDGRWVLEKQVVKLPWAPTRVTLFNMRRCGRLREGRDYRKKGKFIYYNTKRLQRLFPAKPAKANEPAGETAKEA